jgi:hypothetical protein
LKDQVDILREQNHSQRNYEQELTDIRSRLSELNSSNRLSNLEWEDLTKSTRRHSDSNELGRNGQNRTLLSLESESCLTLDRLEEAMDVDKSNVYEDQVSSSPGVYQRQVSSGVEANMNVDETDVPLPTKLNMETTNGDLNDTDDDIEQLEEPALDQYAQKVENRLVQSSSSAFSTSESFSTTESSAFSTSEAFSSSTSERSVTKELHSSSERSMYSAADFTSPEVDSGLETTTSENTPFASRPESELVLPDDKFDEDDVQPTPRQLEKLLEESGASADSSPREGISPTSEVEEEPNSSAYDPDKSTEEALNNTNGEDYVTDEEAPDNSVGGILDTTPASNDSSLSSEESTAVDTTSFNVKQEITKIEARINTSEDSEIEAFEPSLTSEPLEAGGENTSKSLNDVEDTSAESMQENDVTNENANAAVKAEELVTEIKADSLEHEVIAASAEMVEVDEAVGKEEVVAVGEAAEVTADDADNVTPESGEDDTPSPKSLKSGVEAAHRSVEEIISEIQNPDLDSSLEDIQAMVEEAKSELSDKDDTIASPAEGTAGFNLSTAIGGAGVAAVAAGLLSSPPPAADGYDPEDPKVKELEDWELKSHHGKSLHLDDDAYARILGLRRSKTKPLKMEERRLLMEEMERDDNYTISARHNNNTKFHLSCVGSWLVTILIKIFD